MQRHYGGVRGTVLGRGICPHCTRDIPGGYSERDRSKLWLRPHKRNRVSHESSRAELVREWCPGGGEVVPVDQAAMMAHGARLRSGERQRRSRYS